MPFNRTTWVYFIETEDGRYVKIGKSRDVIKRFYALQTANPGLKLLGVVPESPEATEYTIHARFAADHYEGEWFHSSLRIGEFIKSLQHVPMPLRKLVPGIKQRHDRIPSAEYICPEIRSHAAKLPGHVPIGKGKTVKQSEACYENLADHLRNLNRENKRQHGWRTAHIRALMELWPPRTHHMQGLTLAEVDAMKARAAGLV